jgi:hypothetical protein
VNIVFPFFFCHSRGRAETNISAVSLGEPVT